ncbi:Cytoskeleton-associated protein 5 [Amphibalanus amphitrite]|uniref:Cytoskeleton-associated protein 5 n=1 Tax=Amphibalanus amphitrite TaxID=1232801 RepID=A0A6A4WT24_AMPAM|nr:Cytoskeleton-associated protein 5 [Amphibalanus amphitrite]
MEEDNEYLKLSTEDKCQHKLWKARLKGYEEATLLFQQLDEKAPEFNRYAPLIKKFVADSNAVAQEKGLEASLVFMENAHVAGRVSGDVVAAIVQKAIAAPKTSTREKARELLLMVVEIEKYEIVQEELIKGFSQKNPKVVAACIGAMTLALSSFGHKILTLKPLVKLIPVIMEHKDKSVREEAKGLIVELHRWIGAAIKAQLTSLKPVQVSELEAEFEKTAGEKPQQTRFLRSQQDLRAKMEARAEGGDDDDEADDDGDEPDAVDPLDLMEPVNILPMLPKDFYELLEAKKWQERKQSLEAAKELIAKNPRLAAGDYGDLVKALKKVITKDTNVMLVALAGQTLAGLATGLRKQFSPYAVSCMSAILDKFKEKKATVVAALREAADAIYPATSLEAIQEDVVGALGNKNPSIKAETAALLARCFCYCTPAILTKKLLKVYVTELARLLSDSDPAVREAASEALGTAWKVVGEKSVAAFMGEQDPLKVAKVKEYSEKAELKVRQGSAKAAKPAAAPAADKPKVVKSGGAAAAAAKKPAAGKPAAKKAPAKKAAAKSAGGASSSAAAASARPEVTEPELSPEEADQLVAELISEDIIKQLADSNWKTRLEATQTLQQTVSGRSDLPTQAILVALSRKPGLKDNNFQVLKLKFDVVQQLAENTKFSRRSADLCLSDLVDKLGDLKTGGGAAAALSSMAEALSLETISSEVLQLAFAHKSPKVQEGALSWLSKSIREFGFTLKPKPIVNYVRKALAHTNPAIRNAAVALLGTMHLYMGGTLRQLFEDEKPALLQQIDAEFQRVSGEQPPVPTRGRRAVDAAADGDDSGEREPAAAAPVEDLVPREDIGDRVTGALLAELGDKNWKVKFVTANIGELGSALAARCVDSNKNLAAESLRICGELGGALGPHCRAHLKTVVPGLLTALADSKPNIRQAALAALTTWKEQTSLKEFFDGEMLADALKAGTPNTRSELLAWLAIQMKEVSGSLPKDDLTACVPHLYTALEDRSAEVRRAAADAVLPFMIHLSYEAMARHAGKLKPASKTTVMAALDKERPNVPAKAPPKPKSAAAAGRAPPARLASAHSEEELLDDEPSAAPPPGKAVRGGGKTQRAASKTRAGSRATSARSAKDEDADLAPPLQVNNLKRQRVADEVKLKCLKWNFTQPRAEFLEQLKDQMTNAGVNKTLMTQMFHSDFKQHIKAIDTLSGCTDSSFEAVSANLDLLLKWMTLRFFDTNPTVIIKGLEMFHQIFIRLADDEYRLLEQEATAFIPYAIVKLGDPKDSIRASMRNIFRELYKIYPASKVFLFVMDGLKSKNGRQRAECLDEVGYMIETFALGVCQPSAGAALKEVARQIGDRDNAVRKAALNALVQAHYNTGDKLYKLIGNISDKDLSLLEERIKRAPPRAAPPPPAAERPRSCVEPSHQEQEPAPPSGGARYVPAPRAARPPAAGAGDARYVVAAPPPPPPPLRRRHLGSVEDLLDEAEREWRQLADEGPRSGLPTAPPPAEPDEPPAPPRPRNEITEYCERLMSQYPRTAAADMEEFELHWRQVWREMDAIINEPPLVTPTFKHSWTKPNSQSAYHTAELEQWVGQVADPDPATVRRGLERLMTVLKSNEHDVLADHTGRILEASTVQYRRLLAAVEADEKPTAALAREVSTLLTTLLHYPSLADKCSHEALQQLVAASLEIITCPKLSKQGEGAAILAAVNKLTVRLVEKANHTNLVCALVAMLRASVSSGAAGSPYQELLMKCIWKVVRLLPEWLSQLDFHEIMLEIHRFLEAHPSSWWKTMASDTPLRTVKTVLHSLASIFGYQVLTFVGLIENADKTELWAYLMKVLTTTGGEATLKLTEDARQPGAGASASPSPAGGKFSKSTYDQLSEIFKKIGTKENTKEGLVQLYDFRLQNPDADIQAFLSKSSQFFQNYVERGLKGIEAQRLRSGQQTAGAAASASDRDRTWRQEQLRMRKDAERLLAELPPLPKDPILTARSGVPSGLLAELPPLPKDPSDERRPDVHIDRFRELLRHWPEHQHLIRDLDQLQASWRSGAEAPRRPTSQHHQTSTPPRATGPSAGVGGSPQQPVADAAEIEEYRRRLAKFRNPAP